MSIGQDEAPDWGERISAAVHGDTRAAARLYGHAAIFLRHAQQYPEMAVRLHALFLTAEKDDTERHYSNSPANRMDAARRSRAICRAVGLNTAAARRRWAQHDAGILERAGLPTILASFIAVRLHEAWSASNAAKDSGFRARAVTKALMLNYPANAPESVDRRAPWRTAEHTVTFLGVATTFEAPERDAPPTAAQICAKVESFIQLRSARSIKAACREASKLHRFPSAESIETIYHAHPEHHSPYPRPVPIITDP